MIPNENRITKIGNFEPENPFFLAPMAGLTDAPMRRICGEMGASLVYTEMVSAKGLYYGDRKSDLLLFRYPEEKPTAFQIFGHEPDIIAYAAEKLDERDHVILDINMGCPVPKIVKNQEGSALMKQPRLVEEIIRAAVKHTSKPVTAKIRAGFNDESRNAVEVAKAIENGGGAAVAVHGRTREQYYAGRADWDIIRRSHDGADRMRFRHGRPGRPGQSLAVPGSGRLVERTGAPSCPVHGREEGHDEAAAPGHDRTEGRVRRRAGDAQHQRMVPQGRSGECEDAGDAQPDRRCRYMVPGHQ